MPKKKKDEEILSEVGEISREEALESIQAANRAFTSENVKNISTEDKMVDVNLTVDKSTADILTGASNDHIDGFIRNSDGSVNWRKMIKPEYLVFNEREYKEAIEREYGKPLGELTVDEVDDKYLLVLLAGFKDIAKMRGYKSVRYPYINTQPGFASVYCEIEWHPFTLGNYFESGFIQGDGADVSEANADNFAIRFPTAIAFNRAFVRAVRTSLNIPIVGKDEVGPARKMEVAEGDRKVNPLGPKGILESKINKMGRSVESLGKFWGDKGNPEAYKWRVIDDIPDSEVWDILGEFKNLEAAKKKPKA